MKTNLSRPFSHRYLKSLLFYFLKRKIQMALNEIRFQFCFKLNKVHFSNLKKFQAVLAILNKNPFFFPSYVSSLPVMSLGRSQNNLPKLRFIWALMCVRPGSGNSVRERQLAGQETAVSPGTRTSLRNLQPEQTL
jgi:hypothetical protein